MPSELVLVLILLPPSMTGVLVDMGVEPAVIVGVTDKLASIIAASVLDEAAEESVTSSKVGSVDVGAAPAVVEVSMIVNNTESELSSDRADADVWAFALVVLATDSIDEDA